MSKTPKRKRAANGLGTVYERKDGRWAAQVRTGIGPDGKPGRRTLYGRSEQEVVSKLLAFQHDVRSEGLPPNSQRQTVKKYLETWLEDTARPKVRTTTYARYETHVRVHLVPGLGRIVLQDLTPQQVQSFLNYKSKSGLAPATVKDLRAILCSALGNALRWGMVQRNVAALVEAPRTEERQVAALNPVQARALLVAVEGERLQALYSVALSLGLRRGEALGLRWEDVDAARRLVYIRQTAYRLKEGWSFETPKSRSGRRTLKLPNVTLQALQAHRERQDVEREAAGIAWREYGLVFSSRFGTPLEPTTYRRHYKRMLKRAGLGDFRIHDMRHTAISLLIAQGANTKEIQEFAGHSRVGTTLGIYGHNFDDSKEGLAKMMDEMLGGG